MIITKIKKYPGTPFAIHAKTSKNKVGTWDSATVSIFRDDILIGEYIRNYPTHALETCYPFMADGEWYAVYSASYSDIRVMKLHDDRIEDWCGMTNPSEFCPVEIYVPKYNIIECGDEGYMYNADCGPSDDVSFLAEQKTPDYIKTEYCNFGFVSGCMWGDDSSWKLRYIDLSKIKDKLMSMTEKFGYWELPFDIDLRRCVNMQNWEPDHSWISLIKTQHVNLETGEEV